MKVLNISLTDIIVLVLLIAALLVYGAFVLADCLNNKTRKHKERSSPMLTLRAFAIMSTLVCVSCGIGCAITRRLDLTIIFTVSLILITTVNIIVTLKDPRK